VVGLAAAASFVPYLAFFVTPPIAVALPLLVGAGTGSMYSLGLDSLVRQAAPGHLFARTMAVNTAGLLALQALGFALAGAVAGIVGPGRAIAVAGLCGIVIVICLRPRKREVRGRYPKRELTSPQGGLAIDDAELTRTDQESRRHAGQHPRPGRHPSPGQDLSDRPEPMTTTAARSMTAGSGSSPSARSEPRATAADRCLLVAIEV